MHFDVAVIGGGINGSAIARECARAGKRTLLVEQNDFCSGTTSRSTRIIHGGLRYLEHGELSLVRESLRERERLLRERPHLVRPMRFLLALPQGSRHSALAIRAGLWFYSSLGGSRVKHSESEEASLLRSLDSGQPWSIFNYEDAQCEFPERLVAENIAEAANAGAVLRNHCRVIEIVIRDGKAEGLLLHDALTGAQQVTATHIINASGPWVDRVCCATHLDRTRPLIGGVRGSHIVLPNFSGAPNSAVYSEGHDGRPIFVVPWNERLLVGTTEVPDNCDPEFAAPDSFEISYLLQSVRKLFPKMTFTAADVQLAFAGIRPLPYSPSRSTAAITRRHFLHDHAEDGARGLISVIGGKLTTAESLARECVLMIGASHIPEPVATSAIAPADGIACSLRQWSRQIASASGVSEKTALGFAEWFGRRALCVARLAAGQVPLRQPICEHTTHVVAEAFYAVQSEFARTLADVLLRRVPVALGACWSAECSSVAAKRIGAALGWSSYAIAAEAELLDRERAQFRHVPHHTNISLSTSTPLFPAERSA